MESRIYEERAVLAEARFEKALKGLRVMYDCFWATCESPGQDKVLEATKALLEELEAKGEVDNEDQ